jgi:hypothetical protein
MIKTSHNGLPSTTQQRPRVPLWLPFAFFLACLLFFSSILVVLPAWWSPSPWKPLTAIVTPLPSDPQHYSLDDTKLYLVWIEATPIALSSQTPSLREENGCRLTWDTDEQLFVDPCGGSRFFRDGSYKYGPSPRSLTRLPIRVVDDSLEVDTTHPQLGSPHP